MCRPCNFRGILYGVYLRHPLLMIVSIFFGQANSLFWTVLPLSEFPDHVKPAVNGILGIVVLTVLRLRNSIHVSKAGQEIRKHGFVNDVSIFTNVSNPDTSLFFSVD
jgi:hypothetical protein